MFKKHQKIIYSGVLIMIFIFNYLLFLPPCQASARADLQNQLDNVGFKAWGVRATPTSLPQMIQYLISAFLGLLGIIFIVLIIYAGFNWMTASGDEEKVSKAKETLTQAVIGLIIIIAAYSITYFVFMSLPGAGGNAGGGG